MTKIFPRVFSTILLGSLLVLLCFSLLLPGTAHASIQMHHLPRLAANPPPPDPNNPYGLSIGGNTGFNVLDGNGNPVAAQDFHTLGASWARVQINWSNLFTGTTIDQVADPANYNWSLFDTTLQYAAQEGLLLDYPIQGAPGAFLDTCKHPTAQATNNYAQALVSHLVASKASLPLGNLGAIEIGNEEWSFGPSGCSNQGSEYAKIILAVAPTLNGLKATIPALLVGTFGFTNYDIASVASTFWNAFYTYRDSSQQDPGQLVDYVNFHFYHAGANPNDPANGKDPFPAIYAAIQQAGKNDGHPNKPIWVTETGWAISPYPCSVQIVNQKQVLTCRSNIVDQATQWTDEKTMLDDARSSPLTPSHHPVVSHVFFYTGDWLDTCTNFNSQPVAPCDGSTAKIQDGMDIMWRVPLSSGTLQTTTAFTQLQQSYIPAHPTWP